MKKEGKGAKGARKSWSRGLADPFYFVLAVSGGLGMGITLVALSGSHHSPDYLPWILSGSYAFTAFCTA